MKELVKIQSELKAPKNQDNKFGKYKYRSCEDILEALKPLLLENECFVTIRDNIVLIGERFYVEATAIITNKDNKMEEAIAYAREPEVKKGMDESQITGTASSYARKYALNGLFAIDDTKDADSQDNRDKESKPVSKDQTEGKINLCEATECQEVLSDKVASYSTSKFGKPLCMKHQKEYKG